MEIFILHSDTWYSDEDEPRSFDILGAYQNLETAMASVNNHMVEGLYYLEWKQYTDHDVWYKEANTMDLDSYIWSHILRVEKIELT